MKILTKDDAHEMLGGTSLDAFITNLSRQLQLVGGTYSAPLNSGTQIALSKLFAYWMLRESAVYVYITGWGIATEHLDLYVGYRSFLGDKRRLIEAPVHFFEQSDTDAFVSVLCMVLFFSWDAAVFDPVGRLMFQTSHDGWLEIRTNDEVLVRDIPRELEGYEVHLWPR